MSHETLPVNNQPEIAGAQEPLPPATSNEPMRAYSLLNDADALARLVPFRSAGSATGEDISGEAAEISDEALSVSPEYERQYESVRSNLSRSAPELLEGRLPAELEALLPGPYALGTNQSDAAETADDAAEYLNETEGISIEGYGLNHRFLIFGSDSDPEERQYAVDSVVRGYYGPDLGKFVVAFPAKGELPLTPAKVMRDPMGEELLPDDFYADSDHNFVSRKYCAGFIDYEGTFHANPEFMKSSKPSDLGRTAVEAVAELDLNREAETAEKAETPRSREVVLDNDIVASERSTPGDYFSLDHLAGQIVTDVIVETDDGGIYLLKHDGPEGDATQAKFEVLATSVNAEAKTGEKARVHPLSRQAIEGVTLKVGEPMVLNAESGGGGKRTRSSISKITAWNSHRTPLPKDSPKRDKLRTSNVRNELARRLTPTV